MKALLAVEKNYIGLINIKHKLKIVPCSIDASMHISPQLVERKLIVGMLSHRCINKTNKYTRDRTRKLKGVGNTVLYDSKI